MEINSKNNFSGGYIFLCGALRSGTTMLRLMLDHHPDITFPGEFEYVTPLVSDNGDFPSLQSYYTFLQCNGNFLMHNHQIDKSLNFKDLCRDFLLQFHQKETPFIGSTVHHHFHRLPYIWPEARYIWLTRDGRDVARSFIPMGWAGNVWHGVEHWIESEQLWSTFKQTLPEANWIEIKYENLVRNPQKELMRLCRFIGVPYRREMLDYPQQTTYSAPDPSLATQWEHKLSNFEIQLIEYRIGNMLVDRGYGLSQLPKIKVTRSLICKLYIKNKIYCWVFRIKRYGFLLSISEVFARRLNLKNWHSRILTKKHLLSIQYLK